MLFDAEGIVFVVLFFFWIWALLDCIGTDSSMCRNLPKPVWIVLVLFLADIGALAWLLLGRPEKASWRPGSTDYSAPRRPVGLEDSPRYSATPLVTDRRSAELDEELDRWQREQDAKSAATPAGDAAPTGASRPELDAWQARLDEREAELRRRELEIRQRELDQRELDQRERELDD
jgi:hypothetical protein